MWKLLRKINNEVKTIILTTHYLEEAENLCKNIAIIDQGKIIVDISMCDLLGKLNDESFILYLQHPLKNQPSLDGYNFEVVDEKTLEVTLTDKSSLYELFSILNGQGITILSIRNKSNRLEELFIKLTSKSNGEPQTI